MNPETPNQIPQPDNQAPETTPQPFTGPEQYTVPNLPNTPPPPQRSSSKTKFFIIAILLLLAIGAGAYILKNNNKNNTPIGGSISLNGSSASVSTCVPIITTTPDSSSLMTTYDRFAKAVASKNQNCADGLSTSFFLGFAKQEFGAPDGKWITATPAGLPPIAEDFSKLPGNLDQSAFKQAEYTRATVVGSNNTPATGTTLSYPVLINGNKEQISISMVVDNGSLKVDDVVVEPQS